MFLALIRAALILAAGALAFALSTGSESRWLAAVAGACLVGVAVLVEHGLRSLPAGQVAHAGLGVVIGLVGAAAVLAGLVWASGASSPSLAGPLLLGLAWLGAALGSRAYSASATARAAQVVARGSSHHKVLDTSVIIDGRIADIIEAGFLEGVLVIPQFVLRELQQVADSSDQLKRNRGRKGLDILKHVQESDRVTVELTDRDFPEVREVDGKLLALAEELGGKVLTNDYNLNKVAQLRRVPVMNVNDLANALKPVVLPGELLTIQIIKEGKERNQGVGYLDDGTMVVVESGRRSIGQKVDAMVSSVIQTNAGKMIFAVIEEEELETAPRPRIMRRATAEPAPGLGPDPRP